MLQKHIDSNQVVFLQIRIGNAIINKVSTDERHHLSVELILQVLNVLCLHVHFLVIDHLDVEAFGFKIGLGLFDSLLRSRTSWVDANGHTAGED